MPGATLTGVDISPYAIEHADPDVRELLTVGSAVELPFEDDSFDLVISINTLHNLHRADCVRAFAEVQRVTRDAAFVMVDGWKTDEERLLLEQWVLTAHTMLSADDWIALMQEAGYTGDYALWNPLS